MAKIFINNVEYEGNNIVIGNNNRIMVNGVDVTPNSKIIDIRVEGDVERLDIQSCRKCVIEKSVTTETSVKSGNVEVKGNTASVNTQSGNVTVSGSVVGDVKTQSGNVTANTVACSVKTVSGNIKTKNNNG